MSGEPVGSDTQTGNGGASERPRDGYVLAHAIDHSFLKIDEKTRLEDIASAVEEMKIYGFRSLVVHPNLVATVRSHNPAMRICSVVSYPLGCDTTEVKVASIHDVADRGADEVDVVVDLFALRSANFRKIAGEAKALVNAAHEENLLIKLIIETPILDEEYIKAIVRALLPARADFWKTSTGYGRRPTHLSHVRLLANLAPEGVKIKASGGFKTLTDVERALNEGASVIGTSSGVVIMKESVETQNR